MCACISARARLSLYLDRIEGSWGEKDQGVLLSEPLVSCSWLRTVCSNLMRAFDQQMIAGRPAQFLMERHVAPCKIHFSGRADARPVSSCRPPICALLRFLRPAPPLPALNAPELQHRTDIRAVRRGDLACSVSRGFPRGRPAGRSLPMHAFQHAHADQCWIATRTLARLTPSRSVNWFSDGILLPTAHWPLWIWPVGY